MSEFDYSPEELKALKAEHASQATESQFLLWLADCRARKLAPVRDVVLQIRAVKEWDAEAKQKVFKKKMVYITTIQALRKLAERTGKYAGQLPSKWVYLDVNGSPVIESEFPLPENGSTTIPRVPWVVKASILRTGFAHPITVPARFEAYAQRYSDNGTQVLNSTWANRGPEQLEKCAEALALRKAFPEELGSLYIAEEMGSEEVVQATAQTETTEPPKKERKKKTSDPDIGKPWGGQFPAPTESIPVQKTDKRTDFPFGENLTETTGSVAQSDRAPSAPQGATEDVGSSPSTSGPNIHGLDITDDDLPENLQAKPVEQPKVAVAALEDDTRPTPEEKKEILARLKKYPVKTDLIGTWVKTKFKVENSATLVKSQWAQAFTEMDNANSTGKLGELLEAK